MYEDNFDCLSQKGGCRCYPFAFSTSRHPAHIEILEKKHYNNQLKHY